MVDLAVVIVTWNVRDLALDALRSLYTDLETSGLSHAVYVVDNASDDGTATAISSEFPQVKLTASETNLGFGGGNNLALRQMGFVDNTPHPPATSPLTERGSSDERADSLTRTPQTSEDGTESQHTDEAQWRGSDLPRAVYLLNCDTITRPGATRTLFDALMNDPQAGLVGAQLEYGDGSFQHGAFAFPGLKQLWVEFFPTPGRFIEGQFNGRYPRELYQHGEPFEVDFTLGATMMLRREVIQQTGMFDEEFFMYCEEIDWAWRIHKSGWKVLAVPAARIVHLSGQSTRQVKPRSVINLWTSRLRLFDKHYPAWKRWLARWMVAMGMGRKIRQAEGDSGLSDTDRQAIIDAYRQVRQQARGRA